MPAPHCHMGIVDHLRPFGEIIKIQIQPHRDIGSILSNSIPFWWWWQPGLIFAEILAAFLRSQRPNFGFHLSLMGFHLEFSLFWVSRSFDLSDLGDLRRGSGNFFKNYIFEISAFQRKRWGMSQLCGQKFSLNLFTEEVCKVNV